MDEFLEKEGVSLYKIENEIKKILWIDRVNGMIDSVVYMWISFWGWVVLILL